MVAITTGVLALIPASVVATASSTGKLGVCVCGLPGMEHDVKIDNNRIHKKRLIMRRLYNFSEQFNSADVLREKEKK
jgi:hypothetical protein